MPLEVEFDAPDDAGRDSHPLARQFISVQIEGGILTGWDGVTSHEIATWRGDGWEVRDSNARYRFPTLRVRSVDHAAEGREAWKRHQAGQSDPDK